MKEPKVDQRHKESFEEGVKFGIEMAFDMAITNLQNFIKELKIDVVSPSDLISPPPDDWMERAAEAISAEIGGDAYGIDRKIVDIIREAYRGEI